MEDKSLKILKEIEVYENHHNNSQKIRVLNPNQFVEYNREKRRDGTDWMEIYLDNGQKGYILADKVTYFICKKCTFIDDNATGFDYKQLTNSNLPLESLLLPKGQLDPNQISIGTFHLKTLHDSEKGKVTYIDLEYDKNLIEIKELFYEKNDEFYVTNCFHLYNEVENLRGVRGYFLINSALKTDGDSVMSGFTIFIAILIVIGIFLAFLQAGWIVISGLMFVVAFIVAFIIIIIVSFILSILNGIFQSIRKRF